MKNFGDAFYDPFGEIGSPKNPMPPIFMPTEEQWKLINMVHAAAIEFHITYGRAPSSIGVSREWLDTFTDGEPNNMLVGNMRVFLVPNLRGISVVLKAA